MIRGAAVSPRAAETPLRGAWSLAGAPIRRLLPGLDEGGEAGRLWLAADSARSVSKDARRVAWEGWLGGSAWDLEPRLRGEALGPAASPPGHFVAAYADCARGALSLLRDPTGGERLYFLVEKEVLFFSSSLRGLLSLAGRPAPRLDAEAALERGLTELVHFGDRTLVEGVREVLPGHRLTIEDDGVRQRWAWEGLLEPAEGGAASLRARLKEDVERCVGAQGRAAVALSGGLDSSAVAALAAEAVGAENVEAFTVEYEHPGHPSEAPYAAEVCRALGMKPPRIVRITLDDVLGSVAEGVWLTEDPRYWKRAYPMMLARAAAAAGFDRFLSGFGVGSHMGYLEDFARASRWLAWMPGGWRLWARSRRPFPGGTTALCALHPGLEAPMGRLVYPILAVLRARGLVADAGASYPPELGALVERLLSSERVARALAGSSSLPLERQLQAVAFTAMNSCVDVARCERAARAVGARWLGPAHFPGSLPHCYLPARDGGRRRARPGKETLAEAMRGTLPDRIIDRPKYWPHANGPAQWRDLSLARMEKAAGSSWEPLRELFGPAFEPAKRLCPEGMIPLAFWHRLCLSGARDAAPSWEDLGC